MLGELLGLEKPQEVSIEAYKKPRVSPWDIINAINTHDTDLVNPDNEAQCKREAFIVNKGLSYGPDTVIYANEMNARSHLDYSNSTFL